MTLLSIQPVPCLVWLQEHLGTRVSNWTILSFAERKGKVYYCNCQCVCGTKRKVMINNLKNHLTDSCGCKRKEKSTRQLAHGIIRNATDAELTTVVEAAFIIKRFTDVQ